MSKIPFAKQSRISSFFQKLWLRKDSNKARFLLVSLIYLPPILYFGSKSQNYEHALTNTVKNLSQIKIPSFMREYVYTKYAKKYGVNLDEVELPLFQYENFQRFFTRKVKARPEYQKDYKDLTKICCPCDSQIINISKITKDSNLIVKDINYSLSKLLFDLKDSKTQNIQNFKASPENQLHQIIFYLSPGDYHRFHSPTDMKLKIMKLIEGSLRPVNMKSILENGGIVYEENCRKILHFSYRNPIENKNMYLGFACVGALNVSEVVVWDQNQHKKGEQIGFFNIGSTIVMIIETKDVPKWQKKVGDKVRYGQTLCNLL